MKAVMDTDIDVSTGPRPLLILFICFCEHGIFVLKCCPNCHILVAIFNEYLRQRWNHLFTSNMGVPPGSWSRQKSEVAQLKQSKLTPDWKRAFNFDNQERTCYIIFEGEQKLQKIRLSVS